MAETKQQEMMMISNDDDRRKQDKTKCKTKSKKKKSKVVIEGPFGGLKKIFDGFCDPSKSDGQFFDDTSTLASTPSLLRPDLTPQQAKVTAGTVAVAAGNTKSRSIAPEPESTSSGGMTYGYDQNRTVGGDYAMEPGKSKAEGKEPIPSRSRELHIPEPAARVELKATHQGSNLRIRRGLEVALCAILIVSFALYKLDKNGQQILQFQKNIVDQSSEFISYERKKLINIFYKTTEGNGKNNKKESSSASSSSSSFSISKKNNEEKAREEEIDKEDEKPAFEDDPDDESSSENQEVEQTETASQMIEDEAIDEEEVEGESSTAKMTTSTEPDRDQSINVDDENTNKAEIDDDHDPKEL